MKSILKAFCRDERGVTALEYSVLMAIMSGALLIALPAVGSSVDKTVASVDSALQMAAAAPQDSPKQCNKGSGGSGRR